MTPELQVGFAESVASSIDVKLMLELAAVMVGSVIAYKLISRGLRAAVLKAGGNEGDVKMLVGFLRVSTIFLTILIVAGAIFQLGAMAAVIGAFGGMFLGWALQQPVSGFMAWMLITLKRPFRVGDRVQLPSFNLVGDVIDVSPMYTVLNQVGGTVGSEEAVGRHLLIPNAMLFNNLVINCTPRNSTIDSSSMGAPTHMLDEVVVRITFDSDWDAAEDILLRAASEVTADIIRATGKEPYVRSELYEYGILMRLRYATLATDRPRITHEIVKRIMKEFSSNEKVDFAIPYVYSYKSAKGGLIPAIAR